MPLANPAPLAAVLMLLAAASSAQACSCPAGQTRASLDAKVDVIFSGRVLAVDPTTRIASIKVLRVFKGTPPEIVAMRSSPGNCRLRFAAGETRARLRARQVDATTYSTGACLYVIR